MCAKIAGSRFLSRMINFLGFSITMPTFGKKTPKNPMDETQMTLFGGFHAPNAQKGQKEAIMRPIMVKPGVIFKVFKNEILAILPAISDVFAKFNKDCVITSANDGTHKTNSKHYIDLAIDLRSKHLLDQIQKEIVQKMLQEAVGDGYLVLFEYPGEKNEHFHIGFKVV